MFTKTADSEKIEAVPAAAVKVRHTHLTRDIKPKGVCPSCDIYWNRPK